MTIWVAVGLQLGAPLCWPHLCHHSNMEVDHLVTDGLSCCWSEGSHHCHTAINDIVHRALSSAHIPSRMELSGLYYSDGKHPDGITVFPWFSGKLLVWDVTCPDTFAPSNIFSASREAGGVVSQAEERRTLNTPACLTPCHIFIPVAVGSSGVLGPQTWSFLKDLGHRLRQGMGRRSLTPPEIVCGAAKGQFGICVRHNLPFCSRQFYFIFKIIKKGIKYFNFIW